MIVDEAAELVAQIRTAEVALRSTELIMADFEIGDKIGKRYRELNLQRKHLSKIKYQSDFALLEIVDQLDCEGKIDFIFKMFDTDKNHKISVMELAKMLQIVRGETKPFSEAIKTAQLTITANDVDGDNHLNRNEFIEFIASVADYMDKSLDVVVCFWIEEAISKCDGNFILHETADFLDSMPAVASRTCLSMLEKSRLCVIFQLLKCRSGEIGPLQYYSVVEAMSPILGSLNEQFRQNLLSPESGPVKHKVTLIVFLEMFRNALVASPPDFTIDRICNNLSIYLCDDSSTRCDDYKAEIDILKQEAQLNSKHTVHCGEMSQSSEKESNFKAERKLKKFLSFDLDVGLSDEKVDLQTPRKLLKSVSMGMVKAKGKEEETSHELEKEPKNISRASIISLWDDLSKCVNNLSQEEVPSHVPRLSLFGGKAA